MDVKDLGTETLNACRARGWAALETGISRPVPQVADGQVRLWFLLYRSQVQPPFQMLYEPFARVAVDYATGDIVDHQPLPTSDPIRVLGRYPHAAAAVLPRDQWPAVWDELFGLYPEVIGAFAGHDKPGQQQQVARFAELFELTAPPYMKPYYEALNPVFFNWIEQALKSA
jgi:hypothetical protein